MHPIIVPDAPVVRTQAPGGGHRLRCAGPVPLAASSAVTLVFAHRGGADHGGRENSSAAFARALRAGVQLESDIRLSRDGEPVLIHDVVRLIEGVPVAPALLSADALGSVGVLRLADLYRMFGTAFELSLDVKVVDAALPAIEVARAAGAVERMWLVHEDRGLLRSLRAHEPAVRLVHEATERIRRGGFRSRSLPGLAGRRPDRRAELAPGGVDRRRGGGGAHARDPGVRVAAQRQRSSVAGRDAGPGRRLHRRDRHGGGRLRPVTAGQSSVRDFSIRVIWSSAESESATMSTNGRMRPAPSTMSATSTLVSRGRRPICRAWVYARSKVSSAVTPNFGFTVGALSFPTTSRATATALPQRGSFGSTASGSSLDTAATTTESSA
ncbi:hypothetical protein GII30_14320 [Gordonia amarae]|uniref:GP-PDE domain-containing protein n=1 Tax=Gordonia amarae TaxID=36821 RepID=A0A857L8Q4_9ACTN|nr:hypothetical protein GII35_14635 [Gordonia amarae]QHN24407.1 hypothetical protein GII34_14375 [Gordonia amarae]QHN33329.1 hypothetical protein GII32_14485 [Gordonia amarae]QHN42051.1 hypothetical protein GII30_14320 [Gordonia amarae]